MIHNRIHEVRLRFEILRRDAEIARLQAQAGWRRSGRCRRRVRGRACAELEDDFAFVAGCNIGGETLAEAAVERLHAIARRTWLRHFDDRLGLSNEELARVELLPAAALPAREQLLADKPQHLIPRPASPGLDPSWGFRMKVPEHLYNQGELYNLCVSRGTLTAEDRYKINEHIMQTIVMLEQLPLPKNLRRVPEYAGTHHETLRGSGYPRGLSRDQLSVPARIMAHCRHLRGADRLRPAVQEGQDAVGVDRDPGAAEGRTTISTRTCSTCS